MDATTQAQLRLIFRVIDVLAAVDVPVWLFGGWGLDARIGRITRRHGDVEFWVPRTDGPRSKAALVEAGATALATQPPAEACEFIWDDVSFSTAYFDRRADGTFAQLQGRWSDWAFPADSFGAGAGLLDGTPVPAMSLAGMLAMKEQFPTLRNGRPWRDKDIRDIAVLRELLASRAKGVGGMTDPGLSDLRARAAQGDPDAVDQRAAERGDTEELRRVVKALWHLLPDDSEARKRGFDSGVR